MKDILTKLKPKRVKHYVYLILVVVLVLSYAFGVVAPGSENVVVEWVKMFVSNLG